jgi:hypothetical protein
MPVEGLPPAEGGVHTHKLFGSGKASARDFAWLELAGAACSDAWRELANGAEMQDKAQQDARQLPAQPCTLHVLCVQAVQSENRGAGL